VAKVSDLLTHVPDPRRIAPDLRRLARATAYGGGGLGLVGLLAAGLLYGQAELARRWIPLAKLPAPTCDGRYGTEFEGPDIRLAVLGDSSAAGYGVDRVRDTTGALLAAGIVEQLHRPVDVHCHAAVGATSAALEHQVTNALDDHPELTVILIGANDVTHRVRVSIAVGHLADAVRRLRDAGSEVVVCTCPDLGTIRPILPPLRWIARHWSREMAAAQTVAAVAAGGRTVSLGDLLGPQFASAPDRMFAADRFHPSAIGYAAAAAAILPTAVSTLLGPSAERPRLTRAEGLRSLTQAAVEAVDKPGTEVSAAQVSGRDQGPAGRWAQMRQRVRQFTERPHDPASETSAVPLRVSGPAEVEPAQLDEPGTEQGGE
jgi:lysophospholipase L1-like esterase